MIKRRIVASVFASLLTFSFLVTLSCSDSSSSGSGLVPSLYTNTDDTSTDDSSDTTSSDTTSS